MLEIRSACYSLGTQNFVTVYLHKLQYERENKAKLKIRKLSVFVMIM